MEFLYLNIKNKLTMRVVFKTNVDKYKTNCWPDNLQMPPRIGESVAVLEIFFNHYVNQSLPVRMEVVDVIWTDQLVICELHYKDIDIKVAEQNKVNLY